MFYLSYMFAELRRRRGRTVLTALGLAVGVALVVVVSAVSSGLDKAQQEVLAPLTGVGTDMTVTRPLTVSADGAGGFQNLSPAERARLRGQAGPGPGLNLRDRTPGTKFSTDTFSATSQLTFSSAQVAKVAAIDGVKGASGSLTLRANHISGTVPKIAITQGQGGPRGAGGPSGAFGDSDITFTSRTVTGVDQTRSDIAPVTPSQIVKGAYFSATGSPARRSSRRPTPARRTSPWATPISLGGKTFSVIGIASSPIGGTASDVYVKLATLQSIAGFANQISAIQVRAASTGDVTAVSSAITTGFSGSQVTTAADLAERVGGSLKDTRDLSSKLGRAGGHRVDRGGPDRLAADALVGLQAGARARHAEGARLVARRRGAPDLRRVGDPGAPRAASSARWSGSPPPSRSTPAAGRSPRASPPRPPTPPRPPAARPAGADRRGGGFGLGQAAITSGSEVVDISTSPSVGLILLAIGLAVLGGLIAGAVGGLRAARLRPADALRTVE